MSNVEAAAAAAAAAAAVAAAAASAHEGHCPHVLTRVPHCLSMFMLVYAWLVRAIVSLIESRVRLNNVFQYVPLVSTINLIV